MLDLLFVSLMQAALGEPQQPAAAGSAPAVEATEAAAPTEAEIEAAADEARRVRCRTQAYAGSRLGQRQCSSRADDERNRREMRQQLDQLQRPAPLAGN